MKKRIMLMLAAFAATFSLAAFAGTPIKQSELPSAAQTFLSKYFPGDKVIKAEQEKGFRGMEYDVDLASGAEVDFRSSGDWKSVKAAKGKAVPAAIVPAGIAKYAAATFPGQRIVEISRHRGMYEIDLSGGAETTLTAEGTVCTKKRD